MVVVFGTMAGDGAHLIGLPYALTTAFYLLVVGGLFLVGNRTEGTLSIHSITTRRRELFSWATVLGSVALGTAAGDFTADQMQLGYLPSAVIFAAAITVPAVGWRFFRLNPLVGFLDRLRPDPAAGRVGRRLVGKPASHGGGLGARGRDRRHRRGCPDRRARGLPGGPSQRRPDPGTRGSVSAGPGATSAAEGATGRLLS